MTKNITVVDDRGKQIGATYPKRAKGLVKNGRARFIDESTICLACPPPELTGENKMSNTVGKEIGKEIADIVKQEVKASVKNELNESSLIKEAEQPCETPRPALSEETVGRVLTLLENITAQLQKCTDLASNNPEFTNDDTDETRDAKADLIRNNSANIAMIVQTLCKISSIAEKLL